MGVLRLIGVSDETTEYYCTRKCALIFLGIIFAIFLLITTVIIGKAIRDLWMAEQVLDSLDTKIADNLEYTMT